MKLLPTTAVAIALAIGPSVLGADGRPVDRSQLCRDGRQRRRRSTGPEYQRFAQDKFDRQATAMEIAFNEMDTDKNGLVSESEAACRAGHRQCL